MKIQKILLALVLFLISYSSTFASNLDIISREEWWANEQYTNVNSSFWADIFVQREANRVANLNRVYTDAELIAQESARLLWQRRINYVNANYADRYGVSETEYYNGDIKLAWPSKKSKFVDTLVIHHTATEYDSSLEWINDIHKFHSIIRGWGDIGYNFVIWYNGEIYEGRRGGDYVMWAHTSWNNFSTLGISLMWNYNDREVTPAQRESLEKLLSHLIYKYDVSMTKQVPMHTLCTDCDHGITTKILSPITGHRDWGNTSCPWDNIYAILPELNKKFTDEQVALNNLFQKLPAVFTHYETDKLSVLNQKVTLLSTLELSEKNKYIVSELWELISVELGKRG